MRSALSARQEECLRLTAFRTDREIAVVLGISEATVKKHVHEACQRLGVKRRKAALALLTPTDAPDPRPVSPPPPAARTRERDVAEIEVVAAGPVGSARFGYRPPPRNLFARAAMILGLAMAMVVSATTLTHLVVDYHLAVGRLDAHGPLPSAPTARTIVPD